MRRLSPASRHPSYLLACLLAAAGPLTALGGTTYNWIDAAGGQFDIPGDWNPNTASPGPGDLAIFNLNNTYTVLFASSPTNGAFLVQQGNVTFNAGSFAETYSLTGSPGVSGGTLTLGASGSALTLSIPGSLGVEGTGSPVLNVDSHAILTGGTIDIGDIGLNGWTGAINDSGNITQTGSAALAIGAASQSSGTLTINSGGVYNTGTGATTVGATGQLNLRGGTFNLNGTMTISSGGAFSGCSTFHSAGNVINNGTFNQEQFQTWTTGTTFTNSGTAFFYTDTGSSTASPLSISVTAGNVYLAASQHLNALSVTGGKTTIESGTTKTNAFTMSGTTGNWTGDINLSGNPLIVEAATNRSSVLATLQNQVVYGTTHSAGITSSILPAHTALAVIDNANPNLGTFGGLSVDANAIFIAPEIIGDANLDGVVDIRDLQTLANHWQQTGTDWSEGDFDNSGTVNILDLQTLANHWQFGVTSGGGGGDQSFSQALALLPQFSSPTPEPVSLLLLSPVFLLARNRIRRKR